MRAVFKYLTALLFLAIVVQVGMAGLGAFNAIDKAGTDHSITKKQIENGFDQHGFFGSLVILLILLVVICAFVAKVDPVMKRMAVGLVVLGGLQILFAWLSLKAAGVGFLHGINALALYGASALLAHRAWTQRAGDVVPEPAETAPV